MRSCRCSRPSPATPQSTPDHMSQSSQRARPPSKSFTNLRPHMGQSFSREFCTTRTQVLSSFRSTRVSIEWWPSVVSIAGIRCYIDLTRETATTPFPPNHREPNTSLFKRQSTNSSPSRHRQPDSTRPTDAPRHTSPSGKLPPVIEGAAGCSPHGLRHPPAPHLSGPTLLGSILASLHAAQNVESTLKRSPMSFNSTPGLPARGLPIWPQSLLAFPYPHYLEPRKAAKH